MVCVCKQCGKEFVLTDGEIEFYKSKGLNLPKRCKDCRKKNNADNTVNTSNKKQTSEKTVDTVFSYSNKKSSSSKPVFKPSGSSGIGLKPVVISACLIVVAVIALLAGKFFNASNDLPVYNETTQLTNITFNVKETETQTVEEETTTYTQPATTTTVVYTEYYYAPAQNTYRFRNYKLLNSHYEKHGKEMGFSSKESYEAAASAVITNPRAVSKPESDDNDGDMVYYIKSTGEIVFLSSDGYIRTYFIATEDYYNRQ